MMDAAGDLRGALVMTPEMAESGFTMHPHHACDNQSESFAIDQARKHECFMLHGFVHKSQRGFHNMVALVAPDGEVMLRYIKHHHFSPAGEHKVFQGGSSISIATVGEMKISPFICYDLRFPELWRHAALAGAEIMTVSACWPQIRQSHWRAMVIARAVENQAYVLACNRVGDEPTSTCVGGSLVVAPDGEVLAEGGSAAMSLVAEVDPQRVKAWREKFPALRDLHRKLLGEIPTHTSADSSRFD